MVRPRFDIADIVTLHREALERDHVLSKAQRRVLTDISQCRTPVLGAHLQKVCLTCGWEHPVYNSCRNRHCPKCQASAQQKWIDARSEKILPVRHFHLVFTLPSELRPLIQRHPDTLYAEFFRSASEVLLTLGQQKLKATLGLTMVLHTWTRDLRFHTHLHVLATAGGLSIHHGRWVHTRKNYLFTNEIMGQMLRGKMLDVLRKHRRKGLFDYMEKKAWNTLMTRLARHKVWGVYSKAPFKEPEHVLSYLGRYTHRVGIANSRILDVGPQHVTFRTKGKGSATLHPVEFLKRFVQHVLPTRFHKIRHVGLYALPRKDGLLEKARTLLPPKASPKAQGLPQDILEKCPQCGGPIHLIKIFPSVKGLPTFSSARSPPLELACV